MAYLSDCMIEICNTHTITWGYQRNFFSQFTFKLHLAWNVFDCLLKVKGPRATMVNVGAKVATVNILVSSSRNAALIERKMLQYTTLSTKLHHCTLGEKRTQVFILSDVFACFSILCADQKQHSNLDFLTKSGNKTLQTWFHLANEYVQAYKIGASVKNHLFCSPQQCIVVRYTRFL